jgi:hypothetical protein
LVALKPLDFVGCDYEINDDNDNDKVTGITEETS